MSVEDVVRACDMVDESGAANGKKLRWTFLRLGSVSANIHT